MKTKLEKQSHTCSCCHRELPLTAFYIDKHTQRPDRYCKECRKTISKSRHRNSLTTNKHPILIITEIANAQLRTSLILHALQTVRESMERKSKKRREKESREEDAECC